MLALGRSLASNRIREEASGRVATDQQRIIVWQKQHGNPCRPRSSIGQPRLNKRSLVAALQSKASIP